jgi:hypothetical protein
VAKVRKKMTYDIGARKQARSSALLLQLLGRPATRHQALPVVKPIDHLSLDQIVQKSAVSSGGGGIIGAFQWWWKELVELGNEGIGQDLVVGMVEIDPRLTKPTRTIERKQPRLLAAQLVLHKKN